ncbi:MAG: hypothetical protein AAF462_05080 [Thermodesulfobacteriota bacterium]
MSKKEDFVYDVRVAERHIKDGAISKKDYEQHLKNLPDVEEKGEALVIEEDLIEGEEEISVEESDSDEDAEEETQ